MVRIEYRNIYCNWNISITPSLSYYLNIQDCGRNDSSSLLSTRTQWYQYREPCWTNIRQEYINKNFYWSMWWILKQAPHKRLRSKLLENCKNQESEKKNNYIHLILLLLWDNLMRNMIIIYIDIFNLDKE